ncbi:MAG: SEC-C domain-containing protein [Bacteroidales bacterium]
MNNGFLLFKKEAEILEDDYSGLTFEVDCKDSTPYLSGNIHLEDEKGVIIDSYRILIKPTPKYPNRFPLVFEIDERIPKNIDWHVFPDGHCCIMTIPEEILICKKGLRLHSFIENQVIPFFFNQKYRELHGYFLKERPHGVAGNAQFFIELFKTQDIQIVLKGLDYIRHRNEPNRVSLCFCGSGKKYRKCHRSAYRELSVFSDDEITLFMKMLSGF